MSVDLIHEDYSGFFPWVMPKYANEVAYSRALPTGINTGGTLIKLPLATLTKLFWLYKQVTVSASIDYSVLTSDVNLYVTGTFVIAPTSLPTTPILPQKRTIPGGNIISASCEATNTGLFMPDQWNYPDGFPFTVPAEVDIEFLAPLNSVYNYGPIPPYGNVCIDDTVSPPDYYVRFLCTIPEMGIGFGGANLYRSPTTDSSFLAPNGAFNVPMTGSDFLGVLNFHLQMNGVDLLPPSAFPLYSSTPTLTPGAITSTISGDLFVNFADFWS